MTYKSMKKQFSRIFNASVKFIGSTEPDLKSTFNFIVDTGFRNRTYMKGKSIIRILSNPQMIQYLQKQNCTFDKRIINDIKTHGIHKKYTFMMFISFNENEKTKLYIENVSKGI